MVTQKKKAAVWGWGNHAKRQVVPALLKSESFDIAAIISRGFDQMTLCTIGDKEVCFCEARDVLSNTDIDTVYIATPNGLHYQHCLEALNAGKNVLCEKSLTTSLSHSLELIGLARRKQLFLGEVFMYLYHPQYLELKRLLSAGQLGSICNVTCEFGVPLDDPGFRRTATLGGGAFWDVACYNLSILIELFEQTPEVLKASLKMRGVGEEATDESGWALVRLQPNIPAFLSWGYARSYRNHLLIWGDSGSVTVDRVFSKSEDYNSKIEIYDRFGNQSSIATGKAGSFVNMLNDLGNRMDQADCREHYLDAAERQAISMHRVLQKTSAL